MDFSVEELEFIYGVVSTAKCSFKKSLPICRYSQKDRDTLEEMISKSERVCKRIEDIITAYVLAGGEINEAV